ncbi:MAG: tetrahydromethanopterin S-methyltransferase subunit H [Nitrososphaeria archaeon]|nr:tetrahydromethanopterin S-methyltransferase subunit H [Nitrososphaeria archaeon]NIQ32400.1 tetrahydromethanopterin S-methyltransferase subunit H [Nitrososphaeria archaeon]
MWKYEVQQKEFNIGGVKIGGLPGERPVGLVGSIFYHKHRIVRDAKKGEFDREEAERLIKLQEEFSDKTGNPCMLDVIGSTPEALSRYLDFTAGVTDVPLLLDGNTASIRIRTLDFIKDWGLSDRIVYNSLIPEFKREELDKIKEAGIKSIILLAFYTKDFTSQGRIKAVRELLAKTLEVGMEKHLVDTCVLDIPTLGIGCRVIFELKNELGLPIGSGAHNAIGTWKGLKTKMGKQAKKPSMAAASVLMAAAGADFILYGPIDEANYIFPTIAMVDVAYGELSMEEGKRLSPNHPIFKIA